MVLYIKEAGKEILEKGMGYKFGLMEQDMKENGIKIKQMGRVNLYILMAMYMMVNG
jgi:hypothetical protein